MKIAIRNHYSNGIILCGEYESIKDCLEKNRGAYLWGANLGGANLGGANLGGAKNYVASHDFWVEIIRRQKVEDFSEKEWTIIGQVYVHRLCWDSIFKRYGEKIMPIFEKLSKAGFDEWEKYYKDKIAEQK